VKRNRWRKTRGNRCSASTLNLWGAVEVVVRGCRAKARCRRSSGSSKTAQKLKAPSERLRTGSAPDTLFLVLGMTTVMFLIWWLVFHLPPFDNTPEHTSAFYRAMTLLVVASPCALVLSIPSAVLAAIAWGARNGILFRGAPPSRNWRRWTSWRWDKTGTLTTGELAVVGVESFPAGREQEIIELACALEEIRQHPIARAVTRHGKKNGVRELAGGGVRLHHGAGFAWAA